VLGFDAPELEPEPEPDEPDVPDALVAGADFAGSDFGALDEPSDFGAGRESVR
jgi:hypothetical protein